MYLYCTVAEVPPLLCTPPAGLAVAQSVVSGLRTSVINPFFDCPSPTHLLLCYQV